MVATILKSAIDTLLHFQFFVDDADPVRTLLVQKYLAKLRQKYGTVTYYWHLFVRLISFDIFPELEQLRHSDAVWQVPFGKKIPLWETLH